MQLLTPEGVKLQGCTEMHSFYSTTECCAPLTLLKVGAIATSQTFAKFDKRYIDSILKVVIIIGVVLFVKK